jgi:hypothetical protein
LKLIFNYLLLWVFLLPIFILTSISEKYDVNLRILIASIIYISQLTSFFALYLFYSVRLNFSSKNNLKLLFLFLGGVLWLCFLTPTSISYAFKIFLNIFIGFFTYRIFIHQRIICLKILKTILILNVTAVLIETIWFNLFQQNLQIHNSIFSFSRENIIEVDTDFFRPSGLQYEPGNYSIITTIIILLINFLDDTFKKNKLIVITIVSIMLTKSLVGIILAIILFLFFFFKKSYLSLKVVISLIFITLVFSGSVISYLIYRAENIDTFKSLIQKVYMFDILLQKDFYSFMIGNGIESNDNIEYNRNLGFVKDLGVVFNLIYTYGVYGALMIFIIFKKIKLKSNFNTLLLILIISLSKLGTLFPIFFVLIFCYNLSKRNNLIYPKYV